MKKWFRNSLLSACLLSVLGCSSDPRNVTTSPPAAPTGWTQSSALSKGVFYALAADPAKPNVIYAASSTLSVYKTTDGGATWTAANLGLPGSPIRKLLVDPLNPSKLYAALAGGELFKTNDGGASWQQVGQGLSQQTAFSVAYHPYAAPSGFSVASGDKVNSLEWNAVPNAAAYRLYFLSCPSCASPPVFGGWPSIDLTDPTKLQFPHTNLTNGTPYYYVLTAIIGGEETAPSSMISSVPAAKVNPPNPLPPDGIKVTAGNKQNSLRWNAVTSGVTYNVYRQATPNVALTNANKIANALTATTFLDTSAVNGTPAYYVVTESGAPTAPSAEVSAVPSPVTALFVGTGGGGIFASGPAGEFREASNAGLLTPDALDVSSLLIDPSVPHTQAPALYAGTRGGVFRSVDGGNSWVANNTDLTDPAVLSLALSPSGVLYAGTPSGIFKGSAAGSAPWSAVGGASMGSINAIAIDPADSQTIYAASATGGVFKSTDGGGHWTPINQGLTSADVRSILIHPADRSLVYAGGIGVLFKSTNAGGSWTPIDMGTLENIADPLLTAPIRALVSTAGNILYSGGGAQVFKSVDQGKGWTAMNVRLPAREVQAMAVDPNRPALLYAALSGEGVYKSLDGGGSWREENSEADPANHPFSKFVSSVVIDPQTDQLYAGTSGSGVFRGVTGVDGHLTWTPVNQGLTSAGIYSLAIFPGTPAILYAGTFQAGVFKMPLDGGDTWTSLGGTLSDRSVFALAVHPQSPSILFAGTTRGLYKSVDGGAVWSFIDGLEATDIHFILFDPSAVPAGSALWVGAASGTFKSTDEGAHWTHVDDGMASPVYSILVDPQQSNIVYAGTVSSGIFRRTQ